MRDFGFWVRIVAIGQLFFLVLANYGEGWLAPDNPVLTVRKGPAPLEPLPGDPVPGEPEVQEANLWNSGRSDFAGSSGEDRKLDANGWGGGEDEQTEAADEPWVPHEDDNSAKGESVSGESDWGLGA